MFALPALSTILIIGFTIYVSYKAFNDGFFMESMMFDSRRILRDGQRYRIFS